MAPVAGIERRFSHQPVDADFGAQPAEGVVAAHVHRGALDSRHVAAGNLDQLGVEILVLGPAQIHAQHHFRPVLGLGAAGAGLDVEIGVGGIRSAGEHAAEFERFEFAEQAGEFGFGLAEQFPVIRLPGEGEPLAQLAGAGVEFVDDGHRFGELGLFAAERLGPGGLLPNRGLGEFAFDFGQPLALGGIVKDTP